MYAFVFNRKLKMEEERRRFFDAAKAGSTDVLRLFFTNEFNINSTNRFGETALHIAIRYGKLESVEKLLSMGASSSVTDRVGNTIIHTAATYGRHEILASLIKTGKEKLLDLNYRRETPLHLAIRNGHAKCVSLLLESGSSLSEKDGIGDTPAHTAVLYGEFECLKVLLEYGASVFVLNRANQTVSEAAKEYRMKECVDLLEKYEFQGIFTEMKSLGVETIDEFRDMLSKGSYPCYWNRIYLAGQYNVGKTTLAKNLVGDAIPEIRQSTDGIWIYIGRAGMNIEDCSWILLPTGSSLNASVQSMLMSSLHADTTVKEKTRENFAEHDVPNLDFDDGEMGERSAYDLFESQMSTNKSEHNTQVLPGATMEFDTDSSKLPTDTTELRQQITSTKEDYDEKLIKSTTTKEDILNLVLSACKSAEYKMKIVPIDIWDFAGQRMYYMTHQLFISSRGTFAILFNGSLGIHKPLPDLQYLPGQHGEKTTAVYLMHWVNSILTYCKTTKAGFPKILLVATHKDKVAKKKIEKRKEKLALSIEKLFENHSGKSHLKIRPLIFVNAKDDKDPEILTLKKSLMEMAISHPRWGEPMPILWVPLELQLAERVKTGQKIISMTELDEINHQNEQMKLNEKQLITFLRLQHSLGKYLFFSEGHLKNYIVIDPTYLIEVLRSVVTEEEFWPKEEGLQNTFKSMKERGILFRRDLLKIWNLPEFRHILPYQDYMIDLFIHLDIIIEPRSRMLAGTDKSDDELYYIIPCMISNQQKRKGQKGDTGMIMAYKFVEEIIPPAFLYRFIGAFVSMWDLKSLFTDSAVVSVDSTHTLELYVDGGRLVVSLINPSGSQLPTIASTVQESLTRAIVGISQFYSSLSDIDGSVQKSVVGNKNTTSEIWGSPEDDCDERKNFVPYKIEFGINCSSQLCFFPHNLAKEDHDYVWRCPKHKVQHNIKDLTKWLAEKSLHFARKEGGLTCDTNCPGLGKLEREQSPTDQQLGRLATSLTLEIIKTLFFKLGMTQEKWDELEGDYPYTNDRKMFALWEWKQREIDPTFEKLMVQLTEVNMDTHKLCEVFREAEIKDFSREKLSIAPTDELLECLSNNIGKEIIQLGVELGIKGADLQKVVYKYNTKLMEQTREVLRMWKSFKQPVHVLAKAFYRIGKFGVFVNCFNRYH